MFELRLFVLMALWLALFMRLYFLGENCFVDVPQSHGLGSFISRMDSRRRSACPEK